MNIPLIELLLQHQFNDQIATTKEMKKQHLIPPLQKHLTVYIAAMILKDKHPDVSAGIQQME